MLIELRVQNYALIDRLSVRLQPGLNVLTGETGAGKSIIVGALSLLLGERAASEVVRSGADRARLEGVFDLDGRSDIEERLAEQGIESEDGLVIVRREVAAEGRNRAWINGSPATVTFLRELGGQLVDLHGQFEHQTLLREADQRGILDAYGDCGEAAATVRRLHGRLREVRRELEGVERRRREVEERADLLRFQVGEIEGAELDPDEEDQLDEEARRLEHSEDLAQSSEQLHYELYASEDAVTARLDELRRVLERVVRIDSSQKDAAELLDTAYYNLEELGERMREYASRVEHDPGRLDEIQRRKDLLFRLRNKYGPTLDDVIEKGRRAREELDALENADFERQRLEREQAEAKEKLDAAAADLSRQRRDAAERLADEVQAILPDLGLDGGRFEVALPPRPEIGGNGAESIEFRVALNTGFDPQPLSRIASGGELSRVMLALKTILARLDRVPTLVFDEIDAGIGGRVGLQVGHKLGQVAEHHQVFCITHLPQIAARADQHLHVEKGEAGGTTVTRISLLEDDDRVRELARMLGGDPDSRTSLDHARELLGTVPG